MKIAILIVLGVLCWACDHKAEENTYDAALAQAWGADDYGMRTYVFAFLKEGPNRSQDSTKVAEIQAGHLKNIQRLAQEGKLTLAGPFNDDWEMKGIFVFAVETLEEAKALIETDPAVQSGRLTMELHLWYGSAALMNVNAMQEKIAKTSF